MITVTIRGNVIIIKGAFYACRGGPGTVRAAKMQTKFFPGFHGGTYIGKLEGGRRDGQAIMNYRNGDKYNGEWHRDRKQGHGVYIFADGRQYRGEWKADNYEGRGVYKRLDGQTYDGEWKADKKDGHGYYSWPDGQTYEGAFKANKKHGHGVYTWPDGQKYTGEFKRDMVWGRGDLLWAGGQRYIGEFWHGQEHGRGVLRLLDGGQYDGEFRLRKMHGIGTVTLADGRSSRAVYLAGVAAAAGDGEVDEGVLRAFDSQQDAAAPQPMQGDPVRPARPGGPIAAGRRPTPRRRAILPAGSMRALPSLDAGEGRPPRSAPHASGRASPTAAAAARGPA